MFKTFLKTALVCAVSCTVFAQAPENLGLLKDKLIAYHDSGAYAQDIQAVAKKAQDYLASRYNAPHHHKLAIVFDIDETSLSNYQDMLDLNFGGKLQEIIDAEDVGRDTPIKPVRALFNQAKAHHVAIFFITGRNEKARASTIKNLTSAGFNGWQQLILKPDSHNHDRSVVTYKAAMRKKIIEMGYDIVVNIGDQDSDLKGGYADKTFKLPNPYYFLP